MKSTSFLYDLLHNVLVTLLDSTTHWFAWIISLVPFIVLAIMIVITLTLAKPEQLTIIAAATVSIITAPSLFMILTLMAIGGLNVLIARR